MGTAKNESYSRHMSLLSDYVKEVCAYVERGQDLQDMGVDSDMTDKEYAYYMRSVERKHKGNHQIGGYHPYAVGS